MRHSGKASAFNPLTLQLKNLQGKRALSNGAWYCQQDWDVSLNSPQYGSVWLQETSH